MQIISESFNLGNKTVSLETGRLARQADAAVLVSSSGTVVLVTVTSNKEACPNTSHLPLTVSYVEKSYSMGRIPGGFFKREGRLSERETLVSRLIDRAMRPLFPSGFNHEVQIIATVLSYSPTVEADILSLIGASAALCISSIPVNRILASVRVGMEGGTLTLSPNQDKQSALDLVVAATKDAVLMVEAQSNEVSSETILRALAFAQEKVGPCIDSLESFIQKAANKNVYPWSPPQSSSEPSPEVEDAFSGEVKKGLTIVEKTARNAYFKELEQKVVNAMLQQKTGEETGDDDAEIRESFQLLKKKIFRHHLLRGERIGGRKTCEVRPISIETGILPRVHGSALLTRGETQALVSVTLGGEKDAQIVERLNSQEIQRDPFIFHYNFPPFSVGEVGFIGSPKRREIGHGRLARMAIISVLPPAKECPYTVRVVSEILESYGSSSMATVCGASLALMDAGVDTKAQVAGIAMGLLVDKHDKDNFVILSDIMGDEDTYGDMDFKVAGTRNGITALQMDIKICGVTQAMLQKALAQAKENITWILSKMDSVLDKPRVDLSEYAPRIVKISINPKKIRDLIGKGGSTIRSLSEQTKVEIKVEDDGTVSLISPNKTALDMAKKKIEEVTASVEVGKLFLGKVASVVDFGAFINILPGRDGLLHISQIANHRVNRVDDHVREGDEILVKVLEIDNLNRVRLSIKAITEKDREEQGF